MFKRNGSIKRFMTYMLVFIMSFSILSPVLAVETEANPESEFEFSDGVITGYAGTATDVVIPEEIGGVAVTEIAAKAFMKKGLTSVTFPNTLEKIGKQAFSANQLTSVDFPESVKVIGAGSFLVNSISKVSFKNGLEEIGENAFCKCPIEEVTIPGSVKQIGMRAFSNGKQLEKIDIQEGVEHIGKFAFEKNALTSVTIPDFVINIDDGAFQENSISEVKLGDGLERIGNQAFANNEIESITIPNGLKTLARHAFDENPNFEEDRGFKLYLKEPVNDINEIELEAFCATERVGLNWEKTEEIENGYRKYLGHFKDFTNEDGSQSSTIIDTANANLKKMEVIANVLEEAEEPVVDEDWNSKHFTFEGTTVTGFSELGKAKFENNKDLIIPQKNKEGESITVIGTGAFWNDTHAEDKDKIKSLELPDTIEKIEARAFGGNLIKNLEIPTNVKLIDDGAFLSNQIEQIVINEGLESIGRLSFGNNELTEVTIPSTMKELGQRAFFNNKISKLIILPGIEKLGAQCFENNVIQELDIPETVKYLDLGAFVYNSLENVKFPEGLKVVGPKSLAVNNLESVTFPESVEWFCPNSFRKNKGFESGEFKIFIDKTIEVDGNIKESDLKDKLNEEIKVRAAVFEGLIDEPKHKIDIKSWTRVGEEDGYLIYRGKFEEVPVEKIKCGSGTSCENTVENMQMTSLIVKVKLVGELLEPEKPADPIDPEEPVDPEKPDEPDEPDNPNKEVWDAKYFTFEGTTLTGFSELGQEKFATDKSVVIPEKTTEGKTIDSIGDRAFNLDSFGEDGIKSLTLPDTIKTIGSMAFRNNNIVHLELPNSVEELGNGAFASNRDLEILKLSNSLKMIPQGAFSFSKIEKLVIPEGVIEIGGSAFSENKSLFDLTISSTVEKIGSGAFWNAVMVDLTIPGNVKEIGSDAFTGGKLSSLTLEEGIEAIESRAFKRNKLTEVTIPKSVIKLDKAAFDRNPDINIKYASLIEILEEAEKINTEEKTGESIKSLEEAIKAGEAINAKPEATLEEVNAVVKEIREAINGLEDKTNKPIRVKTITQTKVDNKIEITISAFSEEDIKGIVILKPIDENGRVYRVICQSKDFISGENEIKIELKSLDYPKGIKEIKAYIWDSLENMKPLADVKISA